MDHKDRPQAKGLSLESEVSDFGRHLEMSDSGYSRIRGPIRGWFPALEPLTVNGQAHLCQHTQVQASTKPDKSGWSERRRLVTLET